MPKIKIDNKEVIVQEGKTILEAAESMGIEIPTMCYLKGYPHFSSCMVCIVKEKKKSKFLPSCSALAEDGMEIETNSEEVLEERRTGLELLLSEHTGDCEAPCRQVCPAHINIPLMIRLIKEGDYKEAIKTARDDLVLPAVLGRICAAPCEKGCRRSQYDDAVSIRLLVRYIADNDLKSTAPYIPLSRESTGKKIAVVGAGPAGLSAAFDLQQQGHEVTVYDKNTRPGGALRYKVPKELLPDNVLDNEIEIIRMMGVRFIMNTTIGRDIIMDALRKKFDAVVLAPGVGTIDGTDKSIDVSGIFAGGDAVRVTRKAVQSIANGKIIARSVDQFLSNQTVSPSHRKFNSVIGKLVEDEMEEFLKLSDRSARVKPDDEKNNCYTDVQAKKEAGRCLHCDCRKLTSCKLREYADLYGAKQRHFQGNERGRFIQNIWEDILINEPGKCIKCGICVRISEKADIKFGYTFLNRGYNTRIGVPFNEPLDNRFNEILDKCINSCPTGALAYKEEKKCSYVKGERNEI